MLLKINPFLACHLPYEKPKDSHSSMTVVTVISKNICFLHSIQCVCVWGGGWEAFQAFTNHNSGLFLWNKTLKAHCACVVHECGQFYCIYTLSEAQWNPILGTSSARLISPAGLLNLFLTSLLILWQIGDNLEIHDVTRALKWRRRVNKFWLFVTPIMSHSQVFHQRETEKRGNANSFTRQRCLIVRTQLSDNMMAVRMPTWLQMAFSKRQTRSDFKTHVPQTM